MSGAVVTARGLRTEIGGTAILRGVDLDVAPGEVVGIIGPSGGGKTTLLRALNYLTPFTDGVVDVAGHRLTPGMSERGDAAALRQVRMKVGMIFQQFNLFPHLTALQNITEAPRRVLKLDTAVAAQRAQVLLARVGLSGFADAMPRTLSGGQQQRVAIARALAMEPLALLLDEPTSALDPQLAGEVVGVVKDLAASGQTMIIVSHDLQVIRRVAQRVIVVAAGLVVEHGAAAEVLASPEHTMTQQLLCGVS